MTDPRTVAILVAEALHDASVDCDYLRRFDLKSCAPQWTGHRNAAEALLAHPRLASLLLTGAAVERLADFDIIHAQRADGVWIVLVESSSSGVMPYRESAHGTGPDLPSAIAAALEPQP